MSRSVEILRTAALLGLGVVIERGVEVKMTPTTPSVVLKAQEQGRLLPTSTFEFPRRAWLLLQARGLNEQEDQPSFVEARKQEGLEVGVPETFGVAPRLGKAGEQGLDVRLVPSSDKKAFPRVSAINYGHPVSWIAEVPVFNEKDGSMEVFGLLDKPFRITKLPADIDPELLSKAPNVIPTQDGFEQIEPAYVRLRKVHRDGTVEWYVRLENPSVKRLPDGSIDYGNGIIGPPTADQEQVNHTKRK